MQTRCASGSGRPGEVRIFAAARVLGREAGAAPMSRANAAGVSVVGDARLAAFADVRVSLLHAREKAWEDYFDRENPQPMDERIGNEASLARMTALGAVEAVCYQLARAAGEVDNLGLPPPKVERKDA